MWSDAAGFVEPGGAPFPDSTNHCLFGTRLIFFSGDFRITIVYVDMDDVLCAYSTAHNDARKRNPGVEFPQSVPGFFTSLVPIRGALSAIKELRDLFDVYILTAPSTRNPNSYSEKRIWIEEQFDYPFTKKLILSPNKGLLKGDYLIDDQRCGKGQELFEGELIEFGSPLYPDWLAVLEFFRTQAPNRE